jgi:hypothetical protein
MRSFYKVTCCLLLFGVVINVTALAGPTCQQSSPCPGSDNNCNQVYLSDYDVCQNVTGGCCQWRKFNYLYTDNYPNTCSRPNCGQYSGNPPGPGTYYSGKNCTGGGSGMVQGFCDTP